MKITKAMFEKLEYDTPPRTTTSTISDVVLRDRVVQPTIMFVFNVSDLDAAAYHLTQSLQNPFADNAVVTVFVQESILEGFTAKVQAKIISYQPPVDQREKYLKVLDRIREFSAKTIKPSTDVPTEDTAAGVGPIIVCDFTHEKLGLNTGFITTLHAFRTTKEAISLSSKQGVDFVNASIWTENHARAYEIVEALRCSYYFINCFNISVDCLKAHIKNKSSFATMDKGYHFETIVASGGTQKSIVFPYGTIFAN